MFIDVHQSLLYYVVCAWEDDFGGRIIDYGAWPDQGRELFSLREAKPTLGTAFSQAGMEGTIYAGLESLSRERLGREQEIQNIPKRRRPYYAYSTKQSRQRNRKRQAVQRLDEIHVTFITDFPKSGSASFAEWTATPVRQAAISRQWFFEGKITCCPKWQRA